MTISKSHAAAALPAANQHLDERQIAFIQAQSCARVLREMPAHDRKAMAPVVRAWADALKRALIPQVAHE